MTAALDAFIARARAVDLETALELVSAEVKGAGGEKVGPCPICRDGRDRFSANLRKGLWFCRVCDTGGDALKLVAMVEGHDLDRRSGFLETCALLLDEPLPAEAERESEEERAERLRLRAAREAERAGRRAARDAGDNAFRAREIGQARGIYQNASPSAGTPVEAYLRLRIGARGPFPESLHLYLRSAAWLTYWHGRDERGRPASLYAGPAMVAPFVTLDRKLVGCHQTWIDLNLSPKFRPELLDDAGERLPTKKMRGQKKGGLIPVSGLMSALRWVVGEGIETVAGAAHLEGWRDDSFYCAAGDIGNMAGPAAAGISHPTDKRQDRAGRWMPVRVPGPDPKPGAEGEALPLPDHVTTLTLLADGDSELVFTEAAMLRAERRLARPGLAIRTERPPAGFGDFAELSLALSEVHA